MKCFRQQQIVDHLTFAMMALRCHIGDIDLFAFVHLSQAINIKADGYRFALDKFHRQVQWLDMSIRMHQRFERFQELRSRILTGKNLMPIKLRIIDIYHTRGCRTLIGGDRENQLPILWLDFLSMG